MKVYKFTELQEKWLQALESGEYEQTQDELCQGGKYCCLGVATHVFNPDHQALKDNGWFRKSDPRNATKTAPPDVRDALKLTDEHGTFLAEFEYCESLVAMNDSSEFTFKDIAKFIRENPDAVFIDGAKGV
jgi:hypothetical protein